MILDDLKKCIVGSRYRITAHADEEMEEDGLRLKEVAESVLNGEVVENYPKDLPFPSCLILGKDKSDGMIHSVWAHDAVKTMAILITAYRPDPGRWSEGKIRRER